MGIRVLHPIIARLGVGGLATVLIAPILGGLLVAILVPLLMKPDIQARADVDIQPIIGTYASFEVATYVSDFVNALTGTTAVQNAATESGMGAVRAATALTATNEGGNAGASVTFTAPSAEAATRGLRAAVHTALQQITENDRERAQITSDAAKTSIAALMRDFDEGTFDRGESKLQPNDRATAREQALAKAAERLEMTSSDLMTAQASVRAVPAVAESAQVTTEPVSIMTDQVRVVAVTSLIAFIVASILVLLYRRRAGLAAEPERTSGELA